MSVTGFPARAPAPPLPLPPRPPLPRPLPRPRVYNTLVVVGHSAFLSHSRKREIRNTAATTRHSSVPSTFSMTSSGFVCVSTITVGSPPFDFEVEVDKIKDPMVFERVYDSCRSCSPNKPAFAVVSGRVATVTGRVEKTTLALDTTSSKGSRRWCIVFTIDKDGSGLHLNEKETNLAGREDKTILREAIPLDDAFAISPFNRIS
uniref:Uncharacterized protein n=1 Tax=Pristionchus pacificus TaxID=54126 RepID=A0A2A6CNB4_PRIPA|eukprot:PDM79543.1 hypothetical protein PRIPAC_32122 [Pristionchus pacificus]